MDTAPFKHSARNSWPGAMFSRTLLIYYGCLVATMVVVMILLKD
jgi:hypothetical protein